MATSAMGLAFSHSLQGPPTLKVIGVAANTTFPLAHSIVFSSFTFLLRAPSTYVLLDRRRDGRDAGPLPRAATTTSPALPSARPSAASCCRPTISSRATCCSASHPRASMPTASRWSARIVAEPAGLAGRCPFAPERPLGEALLEPTRIYVEAGAGRDPRHPRIKALAHITGGGFPDNIPRVLPDGFRRRARPCRDRGAAGLLLAGGSRRRRRRRDDAHLQLRHRHGAGGGVRPGCASGRGAAKGGRNGDAGRRASCRGGRRASSIGARSSL